MGLSPPTRGSRVRIGIRIGIRGSIPAHAGEPEATSCHMSSRIGSIPAHAGEPWCRDAPERVRHMGLSPPTRGSPIAGIRIGIRGSIPAHAGEPRCPCRHVGSIPDAGEPPAPSGLSPPTRGSRIRGVNRGRNGLSPPTRGRYVARGSIPAHAGEPLGSIPAHAGEPGPSRCSGVYPRLSATTGIGSIPAHAGEPQWATGLEVAWPTRRSIPAHAGELLCAHPGLSPPTRGSMGDPRPRGDLPVPRRVYPRPRGGASSAWVSNWSITGLSPPTRGSPGTMPPHIGLSPPTRGSLLPQHANMTYLLRIDP